MKRHLFVCRAHVIHRAMVTKCHSFGDAVLLLQTSDAAFRNLLKGRVFYSGELRKQIQRLFGKAAVKSVC